MKTSELIGPALDWVVAKTLGYMPAKWEKRQWGRELVLAPEREFSNQLIKVPEGYPLSSLAGFEPSTDWAQGGLIIEREFICINGDDGAPGVGPSWSASIFDDGELVQRGPTPLIAAMRCLVASRLGDDVDVPPELL